MFVNDWNCKGCGCDGFTEEYLYPPHTGKAFIMWKLRRCNHCQTIEKIEKPF